MVDVRGDVNRPLMKTITLFVSRVNRCGNFLDCFFLLQKKKKKKKKKKKTPIESN